MRAKKNFKTQADPIATQAADGHETLFVRFPENPTNIRSIDLTKWLGQGIDEWIWASGTQLRLFLHSGTVTTSTVITYARSLQRFFTFLVTTENPTPPTMFDGRHVDQFLDWLNEHPTWKLSSKKSVYASVKPFLIALQTAKIIPGNRTIFPSNPFPGCNAKVAGETPLSQSERKRFVEALRQDLISIHKGTFDRPHSEALTIYALAIAIRTGINPTPMLELRRNCLRPHPFLPTMMSLESFKRRGNATHLAGLRFSELQEQTASIPMSGVALLRQILDRTKDLASEAPINLQDRVWLYRSECPRTMGNITAMSHSMFFERTNGIIKRHALRADSGEELRINASRLRKTMENRLWEISDGDIFEVASTMGHTATVADNNYLACTNEMRVNATFVGEALPDIYRSGDCLDKNGAEQPRPEQTPVGRCKDTLHGQLAPKDGTRHCADFFSCFSCRSYAIVGTSDDLHRLFSFYWFIDAEREHARAAEWSQKFADIMNLIDTFTYDKFDVEIVERSKQAAKKTPTRFWKNYMALIG